MISQTSGIRKRYLESTFILTFFIQQPPLQVEADAGKIKDSPRDQTVSLQQTRQSKFINSSSEAQVSTYSGTIHP